MVRIIIRLVAMIAAAVFLVGLFLSDLDKGQSWLLCGLIWSLAIANWERP